jgi:hypothetical protein
MTFSKITKNRHYFKKCFEESCGRNGCLNDGRWPKERLLVRLTKKAVGGWPLLWPVTDGLSANGQRSTAIV